ncbi:MAG TPA: ABC transporter permease [Pyrinomonadaceae bacterium]|nr:ABC transporter permease [Pyrinomonadaceae bacterium]
MKKFLAVVKREYIQRVRTKFFVVATILGPVIMASFVVLPMLLASIRTGGPTRLAVVDESGKVYERFRDALNRPRGEDEEQPAKVSPSQAVNANQQDRMKQTAQDSEPGFTVEQFSLDGRSIDQARAQLGERVRKSELDGYVVIPKNILADGKAEFYARNTGDIFTRETVEDRLSNAVRDERLAEKNINQKDLREANKRVSLASTKIGEKGEEKIAGSGLVGFLVVFGFGFLIYMTVLLYGQMVLGAVVEEKETRIAEILFSSIRSFPLMMGKLVGVSLVALSQLSIWGLAFAALTLAAAARGIPMALPHVPAAMFLYLLLYFLMGFFIYATIYAVIGSMVTTTQEGAQLAMPVMAILAISLWSSLAVIRSPNSSLAFWGSMFPFSAPITMLVRIVTETPPLWQILLSLGIGIATIVGLVWLASRIYRIGMLMTGKKATIPEVWRWVRQA